MSLRDNLGKNLQSSILAGMVEWVDAGDLKSPESNLVWVRIPLPALGLSFVAVATSQIQGLSDMNCNSVTMSRIIVTLTGISSVG